MHEMFCPFHFLLALPGRIVGHHTPTSHITLLQIATDSMINPQSVTIIEGVHLKLVLLSEIFIFLGMVSSLTNARPRVTLSVEHVVLICTPFRL